MSICSATLATGVEEAHMAWFWWFIIVTLWVLFIYFTFMLAASKGRSPFLWVILAIFFPLITIIILLVLPPADGTGTA